MKLFNHGIQLLFHKSKISVQKELINIFNLNQTPYFLKLRKGLESAAGLPPSLPDPNLLPTPVHPTRPLSCSIKC